VVHPRFARATAPWVVALAILGLAAGDARPVEDPAKADSPEVADVRQCFADAKAALLAGDGETFTHLVTHDSIRLYGVMRDLAVHADRAELEGIEPTMRMTVLSYRLRVPKSILLDPNPRVMVAHAAANGMVMGDEIAKTEIGDVLVKDREALAAVVVDGEAARGFLVFRKEAEDGKLVWKLDLEHLLGSSRGLIEAMARERKVSEETVIRELLSEGVGHPVGDDVWKPLEPRRSG
jgi:hypothetical protein